MFCDNCATKLCSIEKRRVSGVERKYVLTQLGKQELSENEYVPYMHSHSTYKNFTVWDLNKMLGNGDKSHFMDIVNRKNAQIKKAMDRSYEGLMKPLKKHDPKSYREFRAQDEQVKAVQDAEAKYSVGKDLDWIIGFWEELWRNGGPIFEGSGWMFKLPDFYMKAKR